MKSSSSSEHPMGRKRRCAVLNSFEISKVYTKSKFRDTFKKKFYDAKPFPHYLFKSFVNNCSGIVEDLEMKLQEFPNWKRKENDLYSLYQTNDFKSFSTLKYPELYSFRQFLSNEVKKFLENITNVSLFEEIDVNGSCYSEFDTLLPHNDLIDTRRFAFVYYLSPFIWKKEYGGQLVLLNTNDREQPVSEAKEIDPARNALMVFEVSERSWHAVKEILANSYPRLSINGWFHSARSQPKQALESPIPIVLQGTVEQSDHIFEKYLCDSYTKDSCLSSVQEKFSETSECSISQFLKTQQYDNILNLLEMSEFEQIGPLNKRKIFEMSSKREHSTLNQFLDSLRTTSALKFLSKITGCDLRECKMSTSVYKIHRGCYTVVGDEDVYQCKENDFALETYLFLGRKEWLEEYGGRISYVGNDDEEELVTFYPQCNSFMMVLRDSGAASFLKYINSSCDIEMYMICICYHNVKTDEER